MDFVIGILAGIVTAILIYFFRHYLGFIINTLFFRVYLNVSGEYKILEYDYERNEDTDEFEEDDEAEEDDSREEYAPRVDDHNEMVRWLKEGEEEPFHTIVLRQFAHKLYGEMTAIEGGRVTEVYKVTGKISPTRVIILDTESKTKEHHNFGTFLLRVTQNTNIFRGGYDYLCIICGNVGSTYVFFDKVK